MQVGFWFDLGCPWSWITSRWLMAVSRQRDVTITWRPFSLMLEEAQGRVVDEPLQHGLHAGLRVLEAVRQVHGEDGVGRAYTAFGRRVHHGGDSELDGVREGLREAGFDPEFADAALDDEHDEAIRTSMVQAQEAAGEDVGTPLTRFGPPDMPVFFGPVLSPAPTGEDALRLFDGLTAAAHAAGEGFFELKRALRATPQLPPQPATDGVG